MMPQSWKCSAWRNTIEPKSSCVFFFLCFWYKGISLTSPYMQWFVKILGKDPVFGWTMSSMHFPLASEQPHQKEECQVTQIELESQVTQMMDFKEAEESPGWPAKLDSTMAIVDGQSLLCQPMWDWRTGRPAGRAMDHSTAPVISPLVLDSYFMYSNWQDLRKASKIPLVFQEPSHRNFPCPLRVYLSLKRKYFLRL